MKDARNQRSVTVMGISQITERFRINEARRF
jgi:hypothetical protein